MTIQPFLEPSAPATTVPSDLDMLRHLHEPTQRIHKLHLRGRVAGDVEEARGGDDHGQAPRPRDRDVEAVAAEEEVDVARQVVTARRRHGEEDHLRLAALKFVYRAYRNAWESAAA